jgi:hypothetical protein
MKIRDVILSWDFWCAVGGAVGTYLLLPAHPKTELAKDLYGVGISVLSIVFAVYFAAFAIIMASPDNEFICFMEETGDFSRLLSSLRWTQGALFLALIVSLVLYGWTASEVSAKIDVQARCWVIFFVFMFFYALFSAAAAAHDAVQFSRFRAKFIKIAKPSE